MKVNVINKNNRDFGIQFKNNSLNIVEIEFRDCVWNVKKISDSSLSYSKEIEKMLEGQLISYFNKRNFNNWNIFNYPNKTSSKITLNKNEDITFFFDLNGLAIKNKDINLNDYQIKLIIKNEIFFIYGVKSMISYSGFKPCIIDPANSSFLEIILSDVNQEYVVQHGHYYILTKKIDFNLQLKEESPQIKEQFESYLNKKHSIIVKHKSDKEYSIVISLYQDLTIAQNVTIYGKLMISIGSFNCDFPICITSLFNGIVVLDFGTTHSIATIYKLRDEPPKFATDGTILLPSQEKAFIKNIVGMFELYQDEKLFQNNDNRALPKRILQIFLDCLNQIQFANHDGIQVTLLNIEDFLNRNRIDSKNLMTAFVRWVRLISSHPYFNQPQTKYFKNRVMNIYFRCLEEAISNTYSQQEMSIELAHLDASKQVQIPSTVMLEKIVSKENNSIINKIDSIEVKVGGIKDKDSDNYRNDVNFIRIKEQMDTYNDIGRVQHIFYVEGIKRWLGKNEAAFFMDKNFNVCFDNYQLICKEAISYLLKQVQSNSLDGKYINKVVLTYPSSISDERRKAYKKIAQDAGIENVNISYDEAVAGGLFYVWKELASDLVFGIDSFLARGHYNQEDKTYEQKYLIYDMGGGTTDIALIKIGIKEEDIKNKIQEILKIQPNPSVGRYFTIMPTVLGITGHDSFAGDNITLSIFRMLKSLLANLIIEYAIKPNIENVPAEIKEQYNKWTTLGNNGYGEWFKSKGKETEEDYEQIKGFVEKLIPTKFKFKNTSKNNTYNNFFTLWKEAQIIKEKLSKNESINITNGASIQQAFFELKTLKENFNILSEIDELDSTFSNQISGIAIYREDVEHIVRKHIEETFFKARNLCISLKDNKVKVNHLIDKLVLVGNGSRFPLVQETAKNYFSHSPFTIKKDVTLESPFKYNGQNVIFDEANAKAAVVRGAIIPAFFEQRNVRLEDSLELLNEDSSIIIPDFKIDNLYKNVYLHLSYAVGANYPSLFEPGDEFTGYRNGKKVARKKVEYVDRLDVYRKENSIIQKEKLYASFDLGGKIRQQRREKIIDQPQEQVTIEELQNYVAQEKLSFFVELDQERGIECYLYSPPPVKFNIVPIKEQVDKFGIINKEEIFSRAKTVTLFLQREGVIGGESKLEFTEDKQWKIKITTFGSALLNIRTSDPDPKLVNQITLPSDSLKSKESYLELLLDIENNKPVLKWSVNYLDFEKDCTLIPSLSISSRENIAFNPFKGEE